ncbi:MAG: fumarate hydratase [Actinomycetota bacterium]|nr:fumarate hydratase [Actinomycetota bacterium]
MREIPVLMITEIVDSLCRKANTVLRPDVLEAIHAMLGMEVSPTGVEVMEQIIKNADLAVVEQLPICQDTGYVTVFLEIGREVVLQGNVYQAVDEGVRRAYIDGYLRKSIVSCPLFERENTGDNTPAFVNIDMVAGDKVRIVVMPKGGGTENASQLRMLSVAGELAAVKEFVMEAAENAAKACPPVIVGVGIGGSFDKVGLMAKKALLRPIPDRNPDLRIAQLEAELLTEINKLGIGPAGLGGRITALTVKIETMPTHIACLPVAVAFNCHAARQAEAII